MNVNFITDQEIDRILGRISEYKPKGEKRQTEKAHPRAEYRPRKVQKLLDTHYGVEGVETFSNNIKPAGIIARIYAFTTDLCIVGLVLISFIYSSILVFGSNSFVYSKINLYGMPDIAIWLGGLYAILFFFYLIYFEGLLGQTLGKMFFGIKIVDKANKKPSVISLVLRMFLFFIAPLGLLGLHNTITATKLIRID